MSGISDGKEFYRSEGVFYCGENLKPAEATADTCWYIEIEGRPSLRTTVVASVSTRDNQVQYGDNDPTSPGCYAIAAPMIQAIPVMVEGAPGGGSTRRRPSTTSANCGPGDPGRSGARTTRAVRVQALTAGAAPSNRDDGTAHGSVVARTGAQQDEALACWESAVLRAPRIRWS